MVIKKVNLIERYVISDSTKKLTNKEKRDLADRMFKEKYQGKILSYKKWKKNYLYVSIRKLEIIFLHIWQERI